MGPERFCSERRRYGVVRLRGANRNGDRRPTPDGLVRDYWERAHRAAYLITRDPGDAEDVAQEAMLKAARGLSGYDPSRPLDPWVNRIIANAARDWLRAKALRPPVVEEDPDALAAGDDLADALAELAIPDQIAAALGRLDPGFRAVVVMRHLLDMSTEETADALGIAPGTVRSRLNRSLNQMREQLQEGAITNADQAR